MVRDFDSAAPKGTDKVVACITAQYNSERLIDTAAEVADKFNAELHILHVNKGTSIFNNENTPILLDKLFEYGSEKGGAVRKGTLREGTHPPWLYAEAGSRDEYPGQAHCPPPFRLSLETGRSGTTGGAYSPAGKPE